jgi:PAS domain S-box-containing protein
MAAAICWRCVVKAFKVVDIPCVPQACGMLRPRAKEAQLRKLSAAVEHSPASIVITNPDGAIEYVNPAFSRLTGYSMQEVLGQNPRILKAGDQSEEFYRNCGKVLLQGEEWRGEFHNKRKDGSLFWEMALSRRF